MPMRLSIIIEWANTALNGTPRAQVLLDILVRQWQAIMARDYPATLPPEAAQFLAHLDTSVEVLVVSGSALGEGVEEDIRQRLPACFELGVYVAEGLEYYALKNFGAGLAKGDLFIFLDSDVHPDDGWMAHLLGSFAHPEIHAVSGQPYIAPTGLFAQAFALGWTYELPDETGKLFPDRKFYANNIAFRADLFRQTRFPALNRRTRGAGSLLGKELERRGYAVWQNRRALVDHPPPASLYHMVIRALAHGRDIYMKECEERSLQGLTTSQKTAVLRLARGFSRTFRSWRRVGLHRWKLPMVLAIIASYYGLFALGGLLTHLSPQAIGRRFRV